MSDIATLSTTFELSIPEAVRNARGWQAGQEFVFLPKGESVFLMPVPRRDEVEGLAKDANRDGYRDRSDPQQCAG